MKRLILLLAACLLFTGCLKVLPAAQKSDVTLESIVEANYISTLTAGGQFVIVSSAASGGDSSTAAFFLHGGEIARCEEGSFQGETFCTGAWNGISFTVSDDGRVKASSPTDEFAGDPPAVPLTDSMGRYYADNAFLLYPLLDETADVQTALEHNGKDVTVFAGLGNGEYCTYTVDRKTLHIKDYYESWNDRTVRVTLADEAAMPPTRAGAALMDAGRTRTLTYHAFLSGYEKDYVFEIPADWEFSLEVYGDIRFFDDAGQTKEVENLIPADGKDREIWVSDAKG